MNRIDRSIASGLLAMTITLRLADTTAAQSSTVVLETGYTDRGVAVTGAPRPVQEPLFFPAADRPSTAPATEPARNEPLNAASPAASIPVDPALVPPGTLVVAPGGGAPSARASGPAPAVGLSADSSLVYPALLAIAAMAPLVGWLWVMRRRRPNKARPNAALAEALAAVVSADRRKSAEASHPGLKDRLREVVTAGLTPAPRRDRSDARRELDEALRHGPGASPAVDEDALIQLRQEVLEGLREMKTRVMEFTEALEIGKAELQGELARADRTVGLLRAERETLEQATSLHARRPLETLAEPAYHDAPKAPAAPMAFRPPRVATAAPERRPAPPTLDPAWLLLEDEGDGLWTPPAMTEPRARPEPARLAEPVGVGAVRALASRSGNGLATIESEDPRERRRRIVEMARSGRTIDEISRELRLGRGEVTLALSRAR